MNRSDNILTRRENIVPRGVACFHDLVVESGHGATLTDVDGKSYIDFASGIGAMAIGHSQPAVLEAVNRQMAKLQHLCMHVGTYEPYIQLCEKLAGLLPHGERTKVLLVNSGSEAVENAIKIARQTTMRPAVICFTEALHGRTLLCSSLTSKAGYKRGFGPYAPEVYRLPFPNYYHYNDGLDETSFVKREIQRLKDAMINTVPGEQVAAIIIEILQGEGGFNPCPFDYLKGIRSVCNQYGILLIIDEIQTGFCRTGKWGAFQHTEVVPDISCWAKAMGGGLPISAVIGRAEVMDGAIPGTLGGTYSGNPVSCASALATIDLMERMDLNRRAREIGTIIRSHFESLKNRCANVGDVRGLGSMQAIEFVHDGDHTKPATEEVKQILRRCLELGVLVLPSGTHTNIIRMLPPLVISNEELNQGLMILEKEILRAFEPEEHPLEMDYAGTT